MSWLFAILAMLVAMLGTAESTDDITSALPPVLMHYMPWFIWSREYGWAGYHWKENLEWAALLEGRRIASHQTPIIGPYNSIDRDVIRYHLELMKAAGVEGIIIDWYGTRTIKDFAPQNLDATAAIIEEASDMGLLFTVCYEDYTLVVDDVEWGQEPTGETLNAARERLRLDLAYIRDNYASKPGFLREDVNVHSNTAVLVNAEADDAEIKAGDAEQKQDEEEDEDEEEEDSIVLCPGMEAGQYCDCEYDCTAIPEFCACEDAQLCCSDSDAAASVVCPGQPQENYCDCEIDGDCAHEPEWCQCADAKECCGDGDGPSNRPVMLIFGPRNMKNGTEWTDAMSEVFTTVHDRPKLITLHKGAPEVGDGTFSWFPHMEPEANLGTQDEVLSGVHEYFRDFYAQNEGKLHIGSVFPGFQDYYEQGRNQPSYGRLPEYNGHTFEAAMYQARTNRPTFIQAATWNDWEEGTVFEPREDGGNYFLLKLQQHILGVQRPDDFIAIFDKYAAKKGADFGWPPTDA